MKEGSTQFKRLKKLGEKIVERAESLGIPPEDVVIDCLVQSIGVDERALRLIMRVPIPEGLNIEIEMV